MCKMKLNEFIKKCTQTLHTKPTQTKQVRVKQIKIYQSIIVYRRLFCNKQHK